MFFSWLFNGAVSFDTAQGESSLRTLDISIVYYTYWQTETFK
jgi:hypothetical protein